VTAGRRARTAIAAANAVGTVTVAQLLDGHVRLDLECLDRTDLNGYAPNLQVGGQVVTFLVEHLGNPIPRRPGAASFPGREVGVAGGKPA
jgi:hypothetical protein